MRIWRPSGVRVLLNLVSFAASALAPALAYSQALTLLQSGTRYAGTITPGFNGDFGSATTVSLNTPSYIVFDSHGNQYISDTQNNCVRKIDPSGSMSTVVGLAVSGQGDTCSTASNPAPAPTQGLYHPRASRSTALTTSTSPTANTTASAYWPAEPRALPLSPPLPARAARQPLLRRTRTASSWTPATISSSPFRTPRFFPPSAPIRSFVRRRARASA